MEKKIFPPNDSCLNDVLEFTESVLSEGGCPMKIVFTLQVAVEEIFVNICHYAYKDMPASDNIEISIGAKDNQAEIIFKDSGSFFDPTAKKDPDITLSADERPIGGLGIFMVRKYTDSMEYTREGGFNILTLKKNY